MIHHYITKYWDKEGVHWAESWIQIDLFDWCWCFSKKRIQIGYKKVYE